MSFSSCPDEEGTERSKPVNTLPVKASVSAVVPMRRELKEFFVGWLLTFMSSFSSCPDEEGTESSVGSS